MSEGFMHDEVETYLKCAESEIEAFKAYLGENFQEALFKAVLVRITKLEDRLDILNGLIRRFHEEGKK